MNNINYFLLFANCIAVKGASRSTICDLQNGCYIFLPNELVDILDILQTTTVKSYLKKEKRIDEETLLSFLNKLIKNDLGHFNKNRGNFPKLNSNFLKPNSIEDCIIEISDSNYENIELILESLTLLGCSTLELRSYNIFSLRKISKILTLLQRTRIRNVELYLKYSKNITYNTYLSFLESNKIIDIFVIHSCDKHFTVANNEKIVFTAQKINSKNCCGNIPKQNFTINLPFYVEGLKYNTCLNRKVSITAEGEIKNCPTLSKSFGNIKNKPIENVLNREDFKELWGITKDKINICNVCEFRKICSDCRAFVKGNYDKPEKCKYDPYTMSHTI